MQDKGARETSRSGLSWHSKTSSPYWRNLSPSSDHRPVVQTSETSDPILVKSRSQCQNDYGPGLPTISATRPSRGLNTSISEFTSCQRSSPRLPETVPRNVSYLWPPVIPQTGQSNTPPILPFVPPVLVMTITSLPVPSFPRENYPFNGQKHWKEFRLDPVQGGEEISFVPSIKISIKNFWLK